MKSPFLRINPSVGLISGEGKIHLTEFSNSTSDGTKSARITPCISHTIRDVLKGIGEFYKIF